MKHLTQLLYLRRLKTAIKHLKTQKDAYETLKGHWSYSEDYSKDMLSDLLRLKDKYNSERYFWMKKL